MDGFLAREEALVLRIDDNLGPRIQYQTLDVLPSMLYESLS